MRIRLNKEIDFLQFVRNKYEKKNYKVEISTTHDYISGKDIPFIEVTDTDGSRTMSSEYNDRLASQLETVIAYVCPNCGCEMYSKWSDQSLDIDMKEEFGSFTSMNSVYNDYVKEEVKEMQNLSSCPTCGGKLTHDRGFYIEGHTGFAGDSFGIPFNKTANNEPVVSKTDGSLCSRFLGKAGKFDLYFDEMKSQREEVEKKAFNEKVEDYIALWSDIFYPAPPNEKIEEIKNDVAKLKEHLSNIINLELNVYSLSNRLISLYAQQLSLKRLVTNFKNASNYERYKKTEELRDLISSCNKKIQDYRMGNIGMLKPEKPIEPTYAEPNLFNKKRVLAENEALRENFQKALNQYEEQLSLYHSKQNSLVLEAEKEIDNYNAQIKDLQQTGNTLSENNSARELKEIIDKEVAEAETLLQKICNCRTHFYSCEIVFSKYRDLVALSTFYEYLMAGRCTSLEGANGAYNIYETEIRSNMIIDKLTTVIEKLDDIKDSQYMIYSQLQTVNKNLDRLNNTMDNAIVSLSNMEQGIEHISKNTDVIAHNTAVTAYYSKLNAELTNSLGYIVAFK